MPYIYRYIIPSKKRRSPTRRRSLHTKADGQIIFYYWAAHIQMQRLALCLANSFYVHTPCSHIDSFNDLPPLPPFSGPSHPPWQRISFIETELRAKICRIFKQFHRPRKSVKSLVLLLCFQYIFSIIYFLQIVRFT